MLGTIAGCAGIITGGLILGRLSGDKYRGKVIFTWPVIISTGVTLATTIASLAS